MVGRDPRVDSHIDASAAFAQPILRHIRALVHHACPDVAETIKWGFPHFVYRDKTLASMAAFRHRAALNFWHGEPGDAAKEQGGMGKYGKLARLADLPADALLRDRISASMAMIDSGTKPQWLEQRKPRAALPMIPEFATAIAADPAAATVWTGFAPGKVRDYLEWIGDAKTPATRDRRIAQAVGWIAQGKDRNWQYRR